jgi:hypothetical protein
MQKILQDKSIKYLQSANIVTLIQTFASVLTLVYTANNKHELSQWSKQQSHPKRALHVTQI